MSVPPQPVYNDRYEPVRLVARGGMAEVWLARDALLDRTVALKVLFPELSVDPNFVERFRREAQAAGGLTHPNIVSVYDWGATAGTYFIVMEYVDGRPLSALLRDEGPLLADRAAAIGADVAAALWFAHRHGVIHRDVKPGNVLITPDDHVKVADFGIARAASTEDHLTQTGAVMGTATYFSPEQAQGLPVDQRSDVYALGVVLYEMVTGEPPFVADGPVAVAYKHVHEDPRLPTEIVPEIPAGFEAVVLQALAKDVAHRYATAEELRADLLRFRQGRPVLAEPPPRGRRGPAMGPARSPTGAVHGEARGGARPVRPRPPAERSPDVAMVPLAPGLTGPPPPPAAGRVWPEPGGPPVAERPLEEQPKTALRPYAILLVVLLAALIVVIVLLARQLDLGGGTGGGGGTPTTAASSAAAAATNTPAVTVPTNLIGKTFAAAFNEAVGLGLTVNRVDEVDAVHPVNTVTGTNPAVGTKLPAGQALELDVSSGPAPITEPDVVGEDAQAATQQLQQAGFSVGPQQAKSSGSIPNGQVITTNPPPGYQGHNGDVITLVVSSGPAQVPVPDETGKDQATATADLEKAGFSVGVGNQQSSVSVPSGSVAATEPAAGVTVLQGTEVTLVISSGPAQVRVPYVLNYTEANARADIESRGLVVVETTQAVTYQNQDGVVLDEQPGAGVSVLQGSTVSLVIGQYAGSTTTG